MCPKVEHQMYLIRLIETKWRVYCKIIGYCQWIYECLLLHFYNVVWSVKINILFGARLLWDKVFISCYLKTKCFKTKERVIFWNSSLYDPIIGGSKGGRQGCAPSWSRFFHFRAVFGKKLKNNSNFGSWRTPSGKSWIRYCQCKLFNFSHKNHLLISLCRYQYLRWPVSTVCQYNSTEDVCTFHILTM